MYVTMKVTDERQRHREREKCEKVGPDEEREQ